jgi:hypothetical protein
LTKTHWNIKWHFNFSINKKENIRRFIEKLKDDELCEEWQEKLDDYDIHCYVKPLKFEDTSNVIKKLFGS